MKRNNVITAGLGLIIACIGLLPTAVAKTVERKEIPVRCEGLTAEERPLIAVMDFKLVIDVPRSIGSGMASMLSNALLNSGCFRVVERARIGDIMDEQAFGLSGAVEESTSAGVGRIKGARYQIMGELTEFDERESNLSMGSRILGRIIGGEGGRAAGAIIHRVAHIGFIIKIVDTSSAMLIASESFNKKRNAVGLAVEGWGSSGGFGGDTEISKAMADALEDGIIEATNFLVPYRQEMGAVKQTAQEATSNTTKPVSSECAVLRPGLTPPRIMVIIPEEHITGFWGAYFDKNAFSFEDHRGGQYIDERASAGESARSAAGAAARRIIRPPDPAGETEIMKKLIARGFHVIDGAQMDFLREQARFREASRNAETAADIGREFSADLVITGEAFSEFPGKVQGMMPARARVEAKIIDTRTARILATDGFHASAIDISEVIAGKTALRKAGGLVADAFIPLICDNQDLARQMAAVSKARTKGGSGTGTGVTTKFVVENVTFSGSAAMKTALQSLKGVTKVDMKNFNGDTVTFAIQHSGSTADLAEAIMGNRAQFPIEITGFDPGSLSAKAN